MRGMTDLFKLLSDVLRIRILMILRRKELSVCQLMGIMGVSQPLVSRNLSLLYKGGFLEERREGKLRFYCLRKDIGKEKSEILDFLQEHLKDNAVYQDDVKTLQECSEFQKKAGRCDMKTLQEFVEWKKKKRGNR